jgi:hypothetical protein
MQRRTGEGTRIRSEIGEERSVLIATSSPTRIAAKNRTPEPVFRKAITTVATNEIDCQR